MKKGRLIGAILCVMLMMVSLAPTNIAAKTAKLKVETISSFTVTTNDVNVKYGDKVPGDLDATFDPGNKLIINYGVANGWERFEGGRYVEMQEGDVFGSGKYRYVLNVNTLDAFKFAETVEVNFNGEILNIKSNETGWGPNVHIVREFELFNENEADYSEVDALIAKARKLDPNDYFDFEGVINAIDAVVRGLDKDQQDVVDGYAAAIREAIDALVKDAYIVRVNYNKKMGYVINCNNGEIVGKKVEFKSSDRGCLFAVPKIGYKLKYMAIDGTKVDGDAVIFDVTAKPKIEAVFEKIEIKTELNKQVVDFGKVKEGYEELAKQTVKIENTGEGPIDLYKPKSDNFKISKFKFDSIVVNSLNAERPEDLDVITLYPGDVVKFTIKPVTGLKPGNYSEVLKLQACHSDRREYAETYVSIPMVEVEKEDIDLTVNFEVTGEESKPESKPVSKPTTIIVNTATK